MLDLLRKGVDVAMLFENDPDPEVYWHWHQGRRRAVRVVEVDGTLSPVEPWPHGLE